MTFKLLLPLSALCVFALTSCLPEDDSADNKTDNGTDADPSVDYRDIEIDASSYTNWAYVSLEDGSTVNENEDWDIALQRYAVVAHDDRSMALLASQDDFYSNDSAIENSFVNATADSELEHLTSNYDLSAVSFSQPSVRYAMDASGTFYDYNITNHKLYANTDAVWVIRSSTGNAYAKLRPTQLFDESADNGNGAYETATFELFIQQEGESAFANAATTWTVELSNTIGHECFDIDTAAETPCNDDAWDIQFQFNPSAYQFVLSLNGGVNGSGLAATISSGHFDAADSTELTAGIQDHADDAFDITAYHYASDSQTSVFADNLWYTYNLQGRHGIWPNYRVYAVKNADSTYLVQFINYYDSTGTSGHITLRVLDAE